FPKITLMTRKDNLTKNVGKISSGTFLSRISGLVRDIVLTHFLGVTRVADCFGIAFVIPNMLRGLFGEGALAAAFIPVYTEIKEKRSRTEAISFAVNLLSILTIVLIVLVILGILLAPLIIKLIAPGFSAEAQILTANLTRILFPYLFLIGLTSVIISILNAHSIFFYPSLSPAMLNLGIILPVLVYTFINDTTLVQKAMLFSGGVLLGGVFQLTVNLHLIRKIGYKFKFFINLKQEELKGVWRRMVPGIIGIGIREVNVVVDTLLASMLVTGTVAALQYGNRLMQLPLGVFGMALGAAVLPLFSKHTAHNDIQGLKKSIEDSLNMIILIMLPIIALILVLGKDMIAVVFQHGEFGVKALNMTFSALVFYSFGLLSHSSVRIFATAFFSLKNTKKPMLISAVAVISNIILNIILMKLMQLRGLALATSIAATIQATILFFALRKKIGKIDLRVISINFVKIIFLSVLLGLGLYYLQDKLSVFDFHGRWFLLGKVILLFTIAVLIYILGLKILRIDSAKKIYHDFKA
ncbi:MAG: murein biosynthesis integral membrane protein MurJ, partial [Candidatus Cloacimonadota bacterium]|nr:murein biosynthesis integral membrane protein MurJ [Candidatus Cloacimonadota bacterium]